MRRHPTQPLSIIEDERQWRAPPAGSGPDAAELRVKATRWRSLEHRTREASAQTPDDRHLVAIVLRTEDVRFSIGGRVIHDGIAGPGTVHVTEPGIPARCVFRSPYDVLHLHVPNNLIAECAADMQPRQPPALYSGLAPVRDMIVERLGRAFLAAEEVNGPFSVLYADCISTSIVARLLASSQPARQLGQTRVAELARWRLKRAMDYVEANLGEPVSLADLAAAAGLTRMHFAAQFKAAVGVSPHEYVLRRRIERAQEMLVAADRPLVEIALSVGFQTQSHFTCVFKRFTGQPPHAWRQTQVHPAPVRERQLDRARAETPIPGRPAASRTAWL